MSIIPFFELFPALPLEWGLRSKLDGAYLTSVEVEKEKRVMAMALTVRADLGDSKDTLAAAVAAAYDLGRVVIHQSIAAPAGGESRPSPPALRPLWVRSSRGRSSPCRG